METVARIPRMLVQFVSSMDAKVSLNQDFRDLDFVPSDEHLSNEDTLNDIIESIGYLRGRVEGMLAEARVEDRARGVRPLAERGGVGV